MEHRAPERGFALVTVLMVVALLMTLLTGYFALTRIEQTTTLASMDSVRGFYAAEAGLNVRADLVRQTFVGYNRPAGATPALVGEVPPCEASNQGSGDFGCLVYNFQNRDVSTFIEEPPTNPTSIVIPRGELFQNLNAQEYEYATTSMAHGREGLPEAVLAMQFKSRLVPMFQFAAFYNKDLEILPGPAMTLAGPVHTNGDLYLANGGGGLNIAGQVTAVGNIHRGRKNNTNTCNTGPVSVLDPTDLTPLQSCTTGLVQYAQSYLDGWNGMIESEVDVVTVPEPEALDPDPNEIYFNRADLRIVLDLNGATPTIQLRNNDGTVNALDTATLAGCTGILAGGTAVGTTLSFYNNRESRLIRMLEVDATGLLDCLQNNNLMNGRALDDATEGGLVWYLGVDGPEMDGLNDYGVRVRNGESLASTVVGAPQIRGLTVVTGQAVYVQGSYNGLDKKPAAFLGDSLNILSDNWSDANSQEHIDSGLRTASTTTINAAFLAGTDTTGDVEGPGGQNGAYNGGLENYPRFHEKWSGVTLTYRGSFVSLNQPRHVGGGWVYGHPQYKAPIRDWSYDTDFDDAANLPPLSPRFVYLRQELFVRRFEL